MAETNILTKSNVTHTYTGTSHGAGANSIDGSYDTYQGVYLGSDGTATCISQHEWSVGISIAKISFKVFVQAIAHGEYECNECSAQYYLEYKNSGGSWVAVPGAAASFYQNQTTGQHGGSFYTFTSQSNAGQQTISGLTLTNVLGVRLRAWATSGVAGGGSYESELAYIYELEVLREKYEEAFRVKKGASNIIIGCHALTSSHALRLRRSGITVGIPLLDSTDPMASSLKIRKAGVSKFLPLAD
jgi:hypothetical protein